MPAIKELTEDQFIELLDGYFAPPQKRYKMTPEEIKNLAQRLNKKIDVPIIKETKEEKILIKIIMKVDTFLYDSLPNEFYDLTRSIDGGIDDAEAKRLITRLAKLANEKIDIPYIPEKAEYIALRFVIAIVINAARKKWDMTRATKEINKLSPKALSGEEAESLIVG